MSRDKDPGRLSSQAKEKLKKGENRKLQGSLDHRLRRNLLRLIHRLDPPCTVHEIATADPDLLGGASFREISYHVRVLERDEAVSQVGELGTTTGLPPLYVSNVRDDSVVLDVLNMTAASDGNGNDGK